MPAGSQFGCKRAIVKRSRPKRAPVSTQTLAEKISKALKKDGQNAVFVSTTKGGMKILFEGHHFKYMFRRGPSSIFQCCYQESNEQCVARVVVNQNRVYPLDGEHHHFNQALDKSVTSLMFEATSEDFECSTRNKPAVPGVVTKSESDQFAEDVMQLSEDGTDMEIIIPDPKPSTRNDQNRVVVLANQEITPKLIDKNILTADVFREKIKKRLQKALLGKKKE